MSLKNQIKFYTSLDISVIHFMKTKLCLICNKNFPSSIVIDNYRHNLKNRLYCLDCSPFKQHNTRKLHGDHYHETKAGGDKNTKICPKCNQNLPRTSEFFYITKKNGTFSYCKKCALIDTAKRQKQIKQAAVTYKGGKCQICGYDKCLAALDFHHKNKNEKDFNVGLYRSYLLDNLKPELDKCDLLCANCHREIHYV